MACANHPDRESVAICMTCRKELCGDCRQVGPDGKSYCADHMPAAAPQPQPQPEAQPAPSQPEQAFEMPPAGQPQPEPTPQAAPSQPPQAFEMPPAGQPQAGASTAGGESTVLAALCYLCWILPPLSFVVPIIVLATDQYKGSRYMRHHAWNGLFWGIAVVVVMGALKIALMVMGLAGLPGIMRAPLSMLLWVIGPVALVLSILFAVKANNRETFRIPVISDLADQQVK